MNPNRLEPTKEENEQGIARMRKELRGELPLNYTSARTGRARRDYIEGYTVRAIDDGGQDVEIAFFPYDDFDEGKRREAARILAEELAERLNGV